MAAKRKPAAAIDNDPWPATSVRKRKGVWSERIDPSDLGDNLSQRRRGRHDRTRPPADLAPNGQWKHGGMVRKQYRMATPEEREILSSVLGALTGALKFGIWDNDMGQALNALHVALFGYKPGSFWEALLEWHLEGYARHKEIERMQVKPEDYRDLPEGLRGPVPPPSEQAKDMLASLNKHGAPPDLSASVLAEMLRQVTLGGRGRGGSSSPRKLVERFNKARAKVRPTKRK